MRITSIRLIPYSLPLSRPYSIARRKIDSVDLFYLEINTDRDGLFGLGAASPAPAVTGEEPEHCAQALDEGVKFLIGEDPRRFVALQAEAARRLASTPAARAACDMALWDLAGKILEVPVVDLLGARIAPQPTSITLGIKPLDQMLEEASEYLDRGFGYLKVKIGDDFLADAAKLEHLRQHVGPDVRLRVDANQGYASDLPDLAAGLARLVDRFDIELIEQPLERGEEAMLTGFPPELRRLLAADESIHDARDALSIAGSGSFGILNVKLMKCGGISGARPLVAIAETAGLDLMWGCMDESVISIAAALHVAYASSATRYLDLDGSFDLPSDLAAGGFELRGDQLHLLPRPGLGVEWSGG